MLYSPNVVFFRDDECALLQTPYVVDVVTCASVNMRNVVSTPLSPPARVGRFEARAAAEKVGRAGRDDSSSTPASALVRAVMTTRAKKVIMCSLKQGVRVLILGAWGSGAFRNDPAEAARWFLDAMREIGVERLHRDSSDSGFEQVIFAIPDSEKVEIFEEVFGV